MIVVAVFVANPDNTIGIIKIILRGVGIVWKIAFGKLVQVYIKFASQAGRLIADNNDSVAIGKKARLKYLHVRSALS